MTEPCPDCPPRPKLGYMAWHDDAERRTKRGEKSKQCPTCKLWYWPALQKKEAQHD